MNSPGVSFNWKDLTELPFTFRLEKHPKIDCVERYMNFALFDPLFSLLRNFPFSVETNSGLLCFCFTSCGDWSLKLAPPFQPIRCKTKTNQDLVARALGIWVSFTLSSHWLSRVFFFLLIGCWDYFGFGFTTINRKELNCWIGVWCVCRQSSRNYIKCIHLFCGRAAQKNRDICWIF